MCQAQLVQHVEALTKECVGGIMGNESIAVLARHTWWIPSSLRAGVYTAAPGSSLVGEVFQ